MDIEQASVTYVQEHLAQKFAGILVEVWTLPSDPTPKQRRLLDALATMATAAAMVAEEMGGEA